MGVTASYDLGCRPVSVSLAHGIKLGGVCFVVFIPLFYFQTSLSVDEFLSQVRVSQQQVPSAEYFLLKISFELGELKKKVSV